MKNMIQHPDMKLAIVLTSLSLLGFVARGAEPQKDDLQRGIYEQEINHNTNAAVMAYEKVIHDFEAQKAMARLAVERLAELQSGKGNEIQAGILRERLASEFSDRNGSNSSPSTKQQLEPGLRMAPRTTLLDRPALEAQTYESRQHILEELKKETGWKRRVFAVQTGYGNLSPLMESINQIEEKLFDMKTGHYDPATIKKEQDRLKNAEDQMDLHVDAMIKILELRQAAEKLVRVQFFGELKLGVANISQPAGNSLTLLQGLSQVGLTDFANTRRIKLYRKNQETGKVDIKFVNFDEIKKTPALDIVLQDGDRVEIPQRIF